MSAASRRRQSLARASFGRPWVPLRAWDHLPPNPPRSVVERVEAKARRAVAAGESTVIVLTGRAADLWLADAPEEATR